MRKLPPPPIHEKIVKDEIPTQAMSRYLITLKNEIEKLIEENKILKEELNNQGISVS